MSGSNGTGTIETPTAERPATAPPSTGTAERKNRQVLRAIVVGPAGAAHVEKSQGKPVDRGASTAGRSQAIPDDGFSALSQAGRIVEPPYDLLVLAQLAENSSELGPCIEAMEVNIEGFGHTLKARSRISPDTPEDLAREIREEALFLENFFANCVADSSFGMLRRRMRRDLEATGNGYWEVIRDPVAEGHPIDGLGYLPSHTMRLGVLDAEPVETRQRRLVRREDGRFEFETVTVLRRFRPYVQIRDGRTVWFKEFGDPRAMDLRTGEYAADIENLDPRFRANEVIHFKIPFSSRTPYGLPRYVGNLFSIYGSRAAEEINFATFRNNNIPSMVFLVSNGQLTDATIERMKEFVETQIQGDSNYSRFLIVEAESPFEGMPEPGTVKLQMHPLTQVQHTDALFQKYDANNREKVRGAFRLPPILVGRAADYSRATAETSRKLADEQVFDPERRQVDWVVNYLILRDLGIRYHRFQSNTANVTDDRDLLMILSSGEKTGGLTPRIAREIIADILGRDMEEVDAADVPPDVPFTLTIAREAKRTGPINQGTVAPIRVSGDPTPRMLKAEALSKADRETVIRGIEAKLGDGLLAAFLKQAWSAIREAAKGLSEGPGPIAPTDVDQVVRLLEARLAGFGGAEAPILREAAERLYTLAKTAAAEKAGIEVNLSLVDERSMAQLAEQQVVWIKDFYSKELSDRVRKTVSETLLEQGLGRKEAAAAMRKAVGGIVDGTDSYFHGLAATVRNQAGAFASLEAFHEAGVERYRITAVMDERTTEICQFMDGKTFTVAEGRRLRDRLLDADDPDAVKSVKPWLGRSEAEALGEGRFAEAGLQLPPFHFRCRTVVEPINL